MKQNPFKNNLLAPKSLLVAGIVVLALVFIGILFFGGSKETSSTEVTEQTVPEVPVLQVAEPEAPAQPTTTTSSVKQLNELCEDYSFKQGERAKLDGNTIEVKRIGRTGIVLIVNDEEFMLSENDNERIDGFLVELAENDILYFAADDKDNTVLLRLGCDKSSEDPNDKYVREKGTEICETLMQVCAEQFNIN